MTDRDAAIRRLSSEASASGRPASLRSQRRPSPAGPTASDPAASRTSSRHHSTESQPRPSLPEDLTFKAHPAPPRFQPLFTLVTDASSPRGPATHHPHVHYIFSDDDPDLLMHALAEQHARLEEAEDGDEEEEEEGGVSDAARTRPAVGKRRTLDRAVVVDLVPRPGSSHELDIAYAASLSGDWAVTSARLTPMEGDPPTAGPRGGANESTGVSGASSIAHEDAGPLMLRIEGVGLEPPANTTGPAAAGSDSDREDYQALIGEFEKRMGTLRKVVSAGEERARAMAPPEEDEDETQRPEPEAGEALGSRFDQEK